MLSLPSSNKTASVDICIPVYENGYWSDARHISIQNRILVWSFGRATSVHYCLVVTRPHARPHAQHNIYITTIYTHAHTTTPSLLKNS